MLNTTPHLDIEALLEVPYYSCKYGNKVLHSLDDFEILEREAVRMAPEGFLRAGIDKQSLIVEFTSGTSGIPLKCYRTKEEQARLGFITHKARCEFHGKVLYDRVVEFGSYEKPIRLSRYGMTTILSLSTYFCQPEIMRAQWLAMLRFNPTFIQGFPGALTNLALYAKQSGLPSEFHSLSCLETRAESLSVQQRSLIESVFGFPVSNHYGSREFWTLGYTCKEGHIHIVPEAAYIEIVTSDGRHVEPGEYGDIIITGLICKTMPLIRYRIGDVGRFVLGSYGCGNNNPMLEIRGRDSDYVVTRQGMIDRTILNRMWVEIASNPGIIQAQIEQIGVQNFIVRYVGQKFDYEDAAISMAHAMERILGYRINVKFQQTTSIRPDPITGKVRAFIRNLDLEGM